MKTIVLVLFCTLASVAIGLIVLVISFFTVLAVKGHIAERRRLKKAKEAGVLVRWDDVDRPAYRSDVTVFLYRGKKVSPEVWWTEGSLASTFDGSPAELSEETDLHRDEQFMEWLDERIVSPMKYGFYRTELPEGVMPHYTSEVRAEFLKKYPDARIVVIVAGPWGRVGA